MSRVLRVGGAQLGPISRVEPRRAILDRLTALLRQAATHRCDLVVFPELALSSFFPHWWIEDPDKLDSYFEEQMPNNSVAPLFEEAQRLNLSFVIGYAELDFQKGIRRRFNSAVLESVSKLMLLWRFVV